MGDDGLTAKDEWKAHWPLVMAGMLGFSFFSVITYSLSTFMGPLEKSYGWSRAEISFALTIFGFVTMIGGPPMGFVMDRLGTRRIATAGMVLSSLAFAAIGFTGSNILFWYGLILLFSIVSICIKSTLWSAGVSSVFTKGRSMALAVMLSGSALGQSVSPWVANQLIEWRGWKVAYLGLGLGWGGLATIAVILFFVDARARSQRGIAGSTAAPALGGLELREAVRDQRILRIALANLGMSLFGSGISVHMVRILAETGAGMDLATKLMLPAGVAGLAGKLVAGWALERSHGSLVPFVSFALSALAYFLLLDVFDSTYALSIAVIAWGFSTGAGLQVTTYLTSRYAGLKNFGSIFGTIASAMMLGAALGPLIAGKLYDLTHSYDLLLQASIPVALIGASLFIGLGPYPNYPAQKPPGPA